MEERFNLLLERANYKKAQHQIDGISWCIKNEKNIKDEKDIKDGKDIKGGIIADEMGLGKTLMMIGVMFVNFKRRTLIVLPPVLLSQWAKEIYKCSGHEPLVYHGQKTKTITDEQLHSAPIVLTTYSMLLPKKKTKDIRETDIRETDTRETDTRETDIGVTRLHKVAWNRVIFDEAHHLRNNKTTRYKSCEAIRAPIRWLVTGTPVQNKRADFFNLLKMIGISMSRTESKDDELITKIITAKVLRRTKVEVGINLPPVLNHCSTIEWSNINEKLLAEEIHSLLTKQTHVMANKFEGIMEARLSETGALLAFLRARQSCILPALIAPSVEGLCQDQYAKGTTYSSKLDGVINQIIERKDNGNGKIIFCNFKKEIDFVAEKLKRGGLQKVVIYDGRSANKKKRDSISEAADAIILQIQTGCEGLNLQKNFSEIYFVSPHWNPSIEDQAVARCHRIGQEKPTNVFKFVMNSFNPNPITTTKPITTKKSTTKPITKPDEAIEEDEEEPITLEHYIHKVQQLKRDIISAFTK
jgi:SNF2 family DNA or RNA helicase